MDTFKNGGTHAKLGALIDREQDAGRAPLSALLKAQTHDAHKALENTQSMRNLMSPALVLTEYVGILEKWLHCWSPLETALNRCTLTTSQRHLLPEQRLDRLRHDLKILGGSIDTPTSLQTLPSTHNSGWLGVAYVMQGAQMGGAVISAHLLKTLNLGDEAATFFSPVSEAPVAKNWRSWCQQLDAIEVTNEEATAAVLAAKQTFAHMESHFA